MSRLWFLPSVLLSQMTVCAQTEMKKVVGDNATLPCHHQFWQADPLTLDIEWLVLKPNVKQRAVSDRPKLFPSRAA